MFSSSNEFFSLIVLAIIVIVLSLILILLSYIFAPRYPNSNKLSAYECGFKKFTDLSQPFDIHFYRVGILFLIFDVEIAFLFPWAICFDRVSIIGHFSIFFFLIILLIGFAVEWKLRALNWT